MTVSVQQPFNEYTAAPGANLFAYTFKIAAAADMEVTIDGGAPLELNTDYTLTGVGNDGGGNVTLITPLAGGENVLLRRSMLLNRSTDYQQNGDFLSPVVNNDFDRLWLAMQQFGQDLLRSIKLPFTTTTSQILVQSPAERAKKALVFDDEGNISVSEDDYDDQAAAAAASAAAAAASQSAASAAATAAGDSASAASGSAADAAASAASINPQNLIHTTGDETKSGILTLVDPPVVPAPMAANNPVNLGLVKWLSKGIGELYVVDDSLAGVDIPPIDNPLFRYIKLTASDSYNDGVLTNESVTGTAPLLIATAVIDLVDSPMSGETIYLENTMRTFSRAGNSGALENDAFQGHKHRTNSIWNYQGGSATISQPGAYNVLFQQMDDGLSAGAYGTPRVANETRPRNVGKTLYMRIL